MGLAGQEAAPSPSPAPAASLSAEAGEGLGMMRIYVGGLSKSVTAADVEKTFSALGRVAGLDFVRTNDRSFAYMDFHPASDRSLAKLFSMYNGCIWKGGKLKLEKAKEHYLTRLKKEWEEDANAMLTPHADPVPEKNAVHLKKLDTLKQENTYLNIFFPKLRKVKSVPFKGTGKHKYSFQRIEVPPLPIHFCDCEEHYDEHEIASKTYLSSLDKVINEKELHVMNSVMNKLLKKECNGTTAEELVKPGRDAPISDTSIDNIQCEEVEDLGTDADNLVTNIVMGGSNGKLMHLNGRKTQPRDQETRNGILQPFKDQSIQTKVNSLKRKKNGTTDAFEVTPNKRFHPEMVDQMVEDEFTPILSRNVSSQSYSQETEISAEPPTVKSQTEPDMDRFQSRKGNSWLQKSSWKDLVGKTNSSSFSISDILPGINPAALKTVETNESAITIPTAGKRRKPQSDGKESSSVTVPHNILPDKATGLNHVEESKERDGIQANLEVTIEAKDNGDKEPERTGAEAAASEVMPSKSLYPVLEGKVTEYIPTLPNTTVSEGQSKEQEVTAEGSPIRSQNEPSMDDVPSKKGNSWFQKSSWRDLVGENTSSSFSISNILPGINTPPNLSKNSNLTSATSTAAINKKSQSDEDKSNSMQALQQNNTLEKPKVNEPRHVGRSNAKDGTEVKPEAGHNKARGNGDVVPKRTIPPVGTSEVCTFMRSEESLKEWTRLKSALSGFINKKSTEKDTSRISKGMPSRKH